MNNADHNVNQPGTPLDMARLFASLFNDAFRMMDKMKINCEWGDASQAEYSCHGFKEYWTDRIRELGLEEFVEEVGFGDEAVIL